MFHRTSFLGIAVALSLLTASARGDETYQSPDGLFSFTMPAEPKESSETVQGNKMTFQIHQTAVGVCMVTIMDLPPEAAAETADELQKRLEGGVQKFADSVAGKVLESKKFTFAGKYPAREFRISANPGGMEGSGRGRMYAAKGRLVQLFVLGETKWVDAAEQKPFLDSLKLVD